MVSNLVGRGRIFPNDQGCFFKTRDFQISRQLLFRKRRKLEKEFSQMAH